MGSILIKNGFVADAKNTVFSKQNVLVKNGKIEAFLREEPEADTVIDAEGKIVSPGFIDIHMHEDPLSADGSDIDFCIFDCMLKMGVTTVIAGNCGTNLCDPVRYLDTVDAKGAPVNVAMYAGHSYLRYEAGTTDRYAAATPSQLDTLERSTANALDGGCVGVSYGIRYAPGLTQEELERTAKLCKKDDKLIAAHLRDDAAGVFAAAEEFISAGLKFGLNTEISHIGSMAGFGQMEEFLQITDRYRANGLNLHCDCYPYYAYSTQIGSATYDEGFLDRYHTGYDVVELCEGKYRGMRCTEELFRKVRAEYPDMITVCHVMKHEDVDMAMAHTGVILGSDGLLNNGQGHPRAAGAFPHFIKEFINTGKVSLADGIAKMTSAAAEKLSLSGKGGLEKGSDADIVIFDPKTVKDNATFADPVAEPEGIDYVIIGGKIAVEKGKIINHRLGRAIRK